MMELILAGDFKFIMVQISCEGPSSAGGGIIGSGYTHAGDIGLPKVHSIIVYACSLHITPQQLYATNMLVCSSDMRFWLKAKRQSC